MREPDDWACQVGGGSLTAYTRPYVEGETSSRKAVDHLQLTVQLINRPFSNPLGRRPNPEATPVAANRIGILTPLMYSHHATEAYNLQSPK